MLKLVKLLYLHTGFILTHTF